VSIAPLPLDERRFPVNRLVERLENSSVALRGWNYPHIPREPGAISFGSGYVEGREQWAQYQEVFRFHVNGLFTHRWRMREDGTSTYRGTIHFVSTIYTVAEIWLLARRLYGDDGSVDRIMVNIRLDNVLGRSGSGEFEDLPYRQQAGRNWYESKRQLARIDLVAGVSALAVETSVALFTELGFHEISEGFVDRKTEAFLAGRI